LLIISAKVSLLFSLLLGCTGEKAPEQARACLGAGAVGLKKPQRSRRGAVKGKKD
jgi:hypothetical protein